MGKVDAALHLAELLLGRDHEVVGGALDLGHDRLDLTRRLHNRLGKLADLAGDDAEALARLARSRRLDRGVQCEYLRLVSDAVDHDEHLADLLAPLAELQDLAGRRLGARLDLLHGVERVHDRLLT